MLAQAEKKLSYQYDEIMSFQQVNNKLPNELITYCVTDTNNNIPNLGTYKEQLQEIIESIPKGIDPNSVVFRNLVREYIGTISQNNYDTFFLKLKSLNYASKENVHFLASELIVRAIRCDISVKGFTFDEDPKFKTFPEICADVAKHFSLVEIKNGEQKFQFHDEITKICQQYFSDFIDMNKSMDENNEDTSSNYKGFMTFLGLLYSRGVINIKIITGCMDSVKRAIFATSCMAKEHMVITPDHSCCEYSVTKLTGSKKDKNNELSKLICYFDCNKCTQPNDTNPFVTYHKHIECGVLHKGYEHLMNHVVRSLEVRSVELLKTLIERESIVKNIDKSLSEEDKQELIESRNTTKSIVDKLCSFVDIIIKSHQELINLNKCYVSVSSSAQSKSKYAPPLKNHSIINHNNIGVQLNKLQDKIMPHSAGHTTRYVPSTLTKTM